MHNTTYDEYKEAVCNALQHWLDIHTNPQAWASEWAMDDDWQSLVQGSGIIKNTYFSFDVKSAALRLQLESTLGGYEQCDNCGSIWYSGESDCDCEIETDDDAEEEPEHEYSTPDVDDVIEYWGSGDPGIDDWCIQRAMETEGFAVYQSALGSTIASVVEEATDALKAIEEAETTEDEITALTWANHVMHVNGNIVEDHSGLDYELVNAVSQDGILSVFGDELAEVMTQ